MPTPDAIVQVWVLSLVAYAVVLLAVAALLTSILLTARRIRETGAAIWTVGQKVANNTIHIALLDSTNHLGAQILEAARGVAGATAALRTHAEGCPRCPTCLGGARR